MTNAAHSLLSVFKEEKTNPSKVKNFFNVDILNPDIFTGRIGEFVQNRKDATCLNLFDGLFSSPDPETALSKLVDLSKSTDIERLLSDPKNARGMLRLLGSSNFLANFIINNAEIMDQFFTVNFLKQQVDKEEHLEEIRNLLSSSQTAEDFKAAIRHYKYRQLLRITYLSLDESLDVPQTVRELSSLADSIINACLNRAMDILEAKEGLSKPQSLDFAIIALGKLGARELNYSSDVDLIYIYDEPKSAEGADGTASFKTYYVKLSETLTNILSQRTPDGFLYRVDLRLRPDGDRGAICQSLNGVIRYYEYAGRTWERSIFLRKRFVAGNKALYERFEKSIEPFVFKRYLDYEIGRAHV